VEVIDPSISIEKNPDEQAVVNGDTAHFTITVTNTGDADLTNVTVDDPRVPACGNTLGTLLAGEFATYDCSGAATGWTTNVASVTGDHAAGGQVTDSDEAAIRYVVEPCDNSKRKPKPPSRLLLEYTGTDPEVYIEVTHPKEGLIFAGTVTDGGLFEAARGRGLNPDILVSIYTSEAEPSLIDQVEIHTSCSQPLYIGQTFGTDQSVAKITVAGMPE